MNLQAMLVGVLILLVGSPKLDWLKGRGIIQKISRLGGLRLTILLRETSLVTDTLKVLCGTDLHKDDK